MRPPSSTLSPPCPAGMFTVCVAVGGEETSEFRRQSAALFDAWRPHLGQMTFVEIDGRDHFDILFDLSEPGGALYRGAQSLPNDN